MISLTIQPKLRFQRTSDDIPIPLENSQDADAILSSMYLISTRVIPLVVCEKAVCEVIEYVCVIVILL